MSKIKRPWSPEIPSSFESNSEAVAAYRRVASDYLKNHAPLAQEYLHYLHDSDQRHDIILEDQPDYAIYILVAANEAEKNIRATLDALIQRPFQKPEVFLHGNYTDNTPFADRIDLADKIDHVMEDYRDTPEFSSLRSVIASVRYHSDFSMVELRKEVSDMIAADALERGLPFNYPVVSVDADCLNISRTMLESLVTPIRNEGVTLTYGDSNFGYSDLPDTTETRLATVAEIVRRIEMRHSPYADPYPEESCTAFSIGAYCMAEGYPPLIQNNYDKSNLIAETPILIGRMNALLSKGTYAPQIAQIIESPAASLVPRHVEGALVTRNGRRTLEYLADQLAHAEAEPEKFAETTRLLQQVMKAGPRIDSHIATGGAYNDEFSSQEAMRQHNGIRPGQTAVSQRALNLVLKDYFGPARMAYLQETNATENDTSVDAKLRLQQHVLRRYFDK